MEGGETSSGQHVLMKDQSRIKKAVRTTTIVVNSRDRNFLNYPNSNHFRYTLRRPLTNVMSIELVNGSIPSYIYNIQAAWGSFTFQEVAKPYKITLTPGFYSEAQLATELEARLNAIPGKLNTYTVTVDPTTKRLRIGSTAVVTFTLLFYSGDFKDEIDLNTLAIMSINTPARLLGFGLNDYTSSGGSIISPLPMDLDNFLNRMYLHIEADGKNLDRMEQSAGRRDCFHMFFFQPGVAEYTFLDKETITPIFTSSPAPIARVTNLEISLRDEFNRFVNLNHREMNLIFEITHLE
jgi:hypothetical protein